MTHALVYSILLLFSEIMTQAQRLKIMFRGALQKKSFQSSDRTTLKTPP